MASDQMTAWLEKKLELHGVTKVIPDQEDLKAAYKRAYLIAKAQAAIKKVEDNGLNGTKIPDDIRDQITAMMRKNDHLSWDDAIYSLAAGANHAD